MRRAALALVVLLLLAGAAVARADGYGVTIDEESFDSSGNPSLYATFMPDGRLATPSWAICAPGGASCAPAGVTNRAFKPGPVPAGTRFQATATYAGTAYAALSDPWQGTVGATAPPTLTGVAKVGAVVTPHAATWGGGWGDRGIDLLHVEACRTRDGRGCTTVAHPSAPRYGLRQPLDPRWSGEWLFAFDEHYGRGTVFPAIAFVDPTAIPPTPVGPTVARSAPLGPVAGPALALRRHPLLLRDGRLLLGRATCARTCDVALRAIAGRASRSARLRVRGTRSLTVPGAAGLRLEQGLWMRIRIAGTPLVQTFAGPGQVVAAGVRR